jgi:hypothetical protein
MLSKGNFISLRVVYYELFFENLSIKERSIMNRKTHFVSILFLLLCIISSSNTAALAQQELEWKVKVGDSMTYEFTKVYQNPDEDEDGDPNTRKIIFPDEDGNTREVFLKKGTILEIEIIKLNDGATIKNTFNGEITSEESTDNTMVMKTVDNKTYWEEYAKTKSVGDTEGSVDGNLLVLETEYENYDTSTTEMIFKVDWKTGWFTYRYQKHYNETDTIFEMELTVKAAGGITGIEQVSILLGLVIITLVVSTKRK